MRSLKFLISSAGFLLVLATSMTSHALIVSETMDFTGIGSGPLLGTLDLGPNTIMGTLNSGSIPQDIQDAFGVELMMGFEITELSLRIENHNGGPAGTFSTVALPPGPILGSALVPFGDGITGFPSSILPLSTNGIYQFRVELSGDFSPATSNNWRLNIGVEQSTSPIPVPSTILLFGTGLLGLVGWRRWSMKTV